jgi:hypothetical protein
MREAAGGGGLFLTAERPGVSGDGVAAQLGPTISIKRKSALSDYPLFFGIEFVCRASALGRV